jgi:Fic family protein/DNA-binding XRE family transcriptional regulator
MVFHDRLKFARNQIGLTMQEACQKTGIDQALYSKYEAGKRMPSENHINKLAIGLNINLQELKKWQAIEKITTLLYNIEDISEVFQVAEERIEYLRSNDKYKKSIIPDYLQLKLDELDNLKIKWQMNRPLSQTQLQKLNEYIKIKYTFNSNKIEGNTLSLQETQLVVYEGITIGGKSMREHLEAVNHAEAIDYIAELAFGKIDLNQRILLDLHQLILKSIEPQNAGIYRKVGVRISGSEHIPPDALHLDELMNDYFEYYFFQKRNVHPVILAAEMHERLVSIHPFIDGNGRTARLIMNLILIKNGFTICILKGDNQARLAYYKALEEVQMNNNPFPFYEIVIDNSLESIKEHLSMV